MVTMHIKAVNFTYAFTRGLNNEVLKLKYTAFCLDKHLDVRGTV